MKGKYVCGKIKGKESSTHGAILIPEFASHTDVISMFSEHPTSAGFFEISVSKDSKSQDKIYVIVYGDSLHLKIRHDPRDIQEIKRTLGIYVI